MDRVDVVKGVASQRIYFYPQEGRPTSTPSVSIKDKSGSTITAASTSYVTQDTVNTTVSTANSVGADSIILASVSGIQFRETYLLTNSLLQKEWVRVRSVNSSTKEVVFDEPLEFVHDTAATFQGCGFYRTLQTAEVDTLEELYRARATYTVNSLNYTIEIPFDVVLTPLENRLTVEFIKKHRPDVMRQQHAETLGDDFADGREVAWAKVRKAIRASDMGWRPALLRTPENIEEWALAEFDLYCQMNGVRVLRDVDSFQAIEYLTERVKAEKAKALSSLDFMDIDEDDNRASDEEKPLAMSFIR